MEWRLRTATRSGKFVRTILDEVPPKINFKGNETYVDIIGLAKDLFWPGSDDSDDFTLCHPDGSRWTQLDFESEFQTVSDIPAHYKRTLYVGRRVHGNFFVYYESECECMIT